MLREDDRSQYAAEYWLYEQACENTEIIVKGKLEELRYARRAAAIAQVCKWWN